MTCNQFSDDALASRRTVGDTKTALTSRHGDHLAEEPRALGKRCYPAGGGSCTGNEGQRADRQLHMKIGASLICGPGAPPSSRTARPLRSPNVQPGPSPTGHLRRLPGARRWLGYVVRGPKYPQAIEARRTSGLRATLRTGVVAHGMGGERLRSSAGVDSRRRPTRFQRILQSPGPLLSLGARNLPGVGATPCTEASPRHRFPFRADREWIGSRAGLNGAARVHPFVPGQAASARGRRCPCCSGGLVAVDVLSTGEGVTLAHLSCREADEGD
ncbi:hypothetical protein RKD30_007221 [Streptomyces pristinaespiralis]